MKEALRYDTAVAGATALAERVAPALLPAERRSFREVAVHILMAMLEAYDLQAGRDEVRRREPSLN